MIGKIPRRQRSTHGFIVDKIAGLISITRFRLASMGNSMLKERRPEGRLFFNMGLTIPVGRNPNIDTTPRFRLAHGFVGSWQVRAKLLKRAQRASDVWCTMEHCHVT